MLSQIAIYTIGGKPLMFYLGVLTILSFAITAAIPWLSKKTGGKIKFSWHIRIAKLSFIVAFIHALLVLSVYI